MGDGGVTVSGLSPPPPPPPPRGFHRRTRTRMPPPPPSVTDVQVGGGGGHDHDHEEEQKRQQQQQQQQTPKLILIGGCSGTGKSTFGMSVALDQGILKCISTDTIRSVLRSTLPSSSSSSSSSSTAAALFRSSYDSVTDNRGHEEDNNDDDPVTSWKETCHVLQHSIHELVDEMMNRGTSLVLEGVHIIPDTTLMDRWEARGGVATGILLTVPQEDDHKSLLIRRGKKTGKGERDKLEQFHRIRAIQDELIRLAQDQNWLIMEQHVQPDPLDVVTDRLWRRNDSRPGVAYGSSPQDERSSSDDGIISIPIALNDSSS